MSELDKIKEKILNLLKKTVANGATKAEAESALGKANELMTKYMIESHDLAAYKTTDCVQHKVNLVRRDRCLLTLWGVLARTFDCEFFWVLRPTRLGTFFGYSLDVEMCSYLYDVITRALLSEIKIFKNTRRFDEYKKQGWSSQELVTDFVRGFSLSLEIRLNEMQEQRQEEVKTSTGTDLVVIKQENVKQELGRIVPELKTAPTPEFKKPRNSSYIDGIRKGEEVELNKAIKTKDTKELCQN